ncbi:choice-of-anchor D domain-containing protein [Flavobacterium facile]|uniref:choice-of-anchor D domain-containing protein n=1 Tax=Flavobacterium facile TaxID=2893174 RepID=UPI002E76644C|nr:choice-of-anchor D domain-containing protein [Flavobacterium sp. T-12]
MIKKNTPFTRFLLTTIVFFLLTSVSFSQNANLVISGNGAIIANGDITPSLADFTDFGNVNIGSTQDNTFVLRNDGVGGTSSSRRITFANPAVVISGTGAAQFSIISGPTGGSLLNGLGAVFSPNLVIRFTPTAPAGFKNATITVRYTNNGGALTYVYAIRGNAISAPEMDVRGNGNSIVDGDITPSIVDFTDFGSTSVGGSIMRTYFVHNTGAANLNLGAITFSGANPGDFSITTAPAAIVAPGGNTSFVVTFNPLVIGTKTATISIVNDDSNENPYNYSLIGTCIQTFFDSDGDGIFDNVDIDDDNDGIRDTIEETNCNNANGPKVNYKFLNESFGAGTRTTINTTYNAITTYCYENGIGAPNTAACPTLSSIDLNDGEYAVASSCQIASWAPSYWHMGGDHTGDVNGRMAIFNASYTPGIFYTASITGALPNIPITYSFWVLNIDRTNAPGIATRLRPNVRVEFRDANNNLLTSISTGNIAPTTATNLAGDWVQFTASLNLNVDAFNVTFINNETGGLGNDLALDDILITQALCDLDLDGVADVFDLDSDNDGIEDIIEVGLGNLSNAKGRMDVAWMDANANGLHDSAEGILSAPDFDGDGAANYMDLDSDNDAIFDVDESGAGNANAVSGFVNGDGDITGDGKGDGADTETFRSKDTNGDGVDEGYGDGILDLYDYGFNVYGNLDQGLNSAPFLNYVLDTDGDGSPNYLDVTSNGSFDIANTLYASLDANSDGIIDGNTDVDKDGIVDAFDTNTAYFGSPRDLNRKLLLEFDGRNDYAQSTPVLGGLPSATLMSWVNLANGYNADGVIVGQNNFQLKVSNIKRLQATVNGTTVTFNTALNTNQWYHVAAIYSGGSVRLYLNGLQVASQALAGNIAVDVSVLTLGKNPISATNYFRGKMDEVRVFNIGLTDAQLQRMVYQEVRNNATQLRGEVVPKDVGTLPFVNLVRYYRMDVYKDDIIDDLSTPAIDLVGTKIFNHKVINLQQAPMPFLTERTGDFATAVNSPTKEIRGMDIMDYDWSIVNVAHNITETSNSTDLGLFLNPGVSINMTNDNKLQNDWYLLLDGVVDLVGRSQLVQTTQSDLEPTSDGWIERDQQGVSNLFNYNYWSSPVGPINGSVNNNNYTVASVMRDGTNPASPTPINWVGGYNGAPTSPISVARFWIWTFQNVTGVYANWSQVLETGTLRPSQGFTMKGSGALTPKQNYTFVGKPFNGTITNPISANNLNLSGNPYASALDADKFIDDNVSSLAGPSGATNGTLYFWEQSALNNTHVLQGYQGGYAAYTKVGGTPPIAPPGISGLGGNTKIAQRFIPVGQSFFVFGSATGGTITFNNSQRLFVKENDPSSFEIFKNSNQSVHANPNVVTNANDAYSVRKFGKIRLGFNSTNNFHRQILLGFMNERASDNFDPGYDGIHLDDQPNDMFFRSQETNLIIQGVGFFNPLKRHPISIKTNQDGYVEIVLDDVENFDLNRKIFIFDNETGIFHNIKTQPFKVKLEVGVHNDRFYLTFTNRSSSNVIAKQSNDSLNKEENTNETLVVNYENTNQVVQISNEDINVTVKNVYLYNLVGQLVNTWDVRNENQANIQIPMTSNSTGVYIVKVETSNGSFSKKISIK